MLFRITRRLKFLFVVYDELLVTSASGRWVTWEAEKFAERLEWTRRFLERWPARAVAMLAPKES